MIVVVIIVIIIVVMLLSYVGYRYFKKKINKDTKFNEEEKSFQKGALDVVQKFMLRKEFKVLNIISKVIPEGYIAFPKIVLSTIIEPMGYCSVYDKVCNKTVDVVVFEENTLKPVIAIDIYDNSPGDFSLETEEPLIIRALQMAGLPLVGIKVKLDYDEFEIKNTIWEHIMPKELGRTDRSVDS